MHLLNAVTFTYVGAWSYILAFKGENINSRVFQGCFVSIFQSNLGFWRNKVPWILDFLPRICVNNGRQRPHAHATSTCVCLADLHINERASFDLITVIVVGVLAYSTVLAKVLLTSLTFLHIFEENVLTMLFLRKLSSLGTPVLDYKSCNMTRFFHCLAF